MSCLLRLEGVTKSFRAKPNPVEALRGVTLEVKAAEMVALMGPSGSGKSTALSLAGLMLRPTSGTVFLSGEPAPDDERGRARLRNSFVGTVHQSYAVIGDINGIANVEIPLEYASPRLPRGRRRELAREALGKVGLGEDVYSRRASSMSGGQQQRVAIARALAMKPDIMLFDEPTSALDPELTGEVLHTMRELAAEHMTMIVVTHEMAFAREAAANVVFMENGVIVEQGAPQTFFSTPKEERTREFLRNML